MAIVYTDTSILKRLADGTEVLSSYVDTDAGEERLGAFLNLARFDKPSDDGQGGGQGEVDGPHVDSVSPNTGPYTFTPTQVVFTGTGFDPAGSYYVHVYFDNPDVTGDVRAVDSVDSDTQISATITAGSSTDGVIPGPGQAWVQLYQGLTPIDDPQVFTYV